MNFFNESPWLTRMDMIMLVLSLGCLLLWSAWQGIQRLRKRGKTARTGLDDARELEQLDREREDDAERVARGLVSVINFGGLPRLPDSGFDPTGRFIAQLPQDVQNLIARLRSFVEKEILLWIAPDRWDSGRGDYPYTGHGHRGRFTLRWPDITVPVVSTDAITGEPYTWNQTRSLRLETHSGGAWTWAWVSHSTILEDNNGGVGIEQYRMYLRGRERVPEACPEHVGRAKAEKEAQVTAEDGGET